MKPKAIPGFSNYTIDNGANVWSAFNWRGYGPRKITPIKDSDGYLCVRLVGDNGTRKKLRVHRLMASLFLGVKPSPHHEVCHNDGNCLNNKPSNLRWGTRRDNAKDREIHGRTSNGKKHSQAIITGLARAAIAKATNTKEQWAVDFFSEGR